MELSEKLEVNIEIPNIVEEASGGLDLNTPLTATIFGQMILDLIQRTFKVCDEALQNGRLTSEDIGAIDPGRRPDQSPIIQRCGEDYFFKEPQSLHYGDVGSVGSSAVGRWPSARLGNAAEHCSGRT